MKTDMNEAVVMTNRLWVLLDGLHGHEPDTLRGSAEKARISGELLYAAHCADLVRAEVLSQYHVFKGREDVPLINAA